jgi:ACS family tartrate transporter-like MFS transporter
MPFLLLLFLLAFLDRTNVSVAALDMKKELGFTEAVVGAGAGIFFLGYFLLEIPGTLIVERWSARKWIARIMVSWGIVASMMGLIGLPIFKFLHAEAQFNSLRFILGLAEAGFFPGVMVYLSHWFRYEDRAKTKSFFLIGIPLATVISNPLSQAIMHNINWAGLAGWRWVFILEGLPAVAIGVVTYFYLTDRPQDAAWLPDDEKAWIVGEMEKEKQIKLAAGGGDIVRGLLNPHVILLAFIYLFAVTGMYGLTFFLPTIVATFKDTSVLAQTVISTLPYVLGLFAILVNGAHSDKTKERRWHTAVPLLLAGVSMGGCALFADNKALSVVCLCCLGLSLYAYLPAFWTHPTSRLAASSAAIAVGLINSVGNLGGYFGPKIVGELATKSGSFQSGLWFLTACIFAAGVLAIFLIPKTSVKT